MRVHVVPTAEAVVPGQLAGVTVLVVDVLRASTTIVTALASGCTAVVPVGDAPSALSRARAGGALAAGERRGEPLAGFDLGNSPLECGPERVGGRTVFFTTSNGTRALLAARGAAAVGVAALVNAGAAAAWAAAEGRDVVVLCAGERGRPSLEDDVCAGLLVERLTAAGRAPSPAALAALPAARRYGADVARLAADSAWARHLARRGRGRDVAACLALDTTRLVPVYLASVDKIVAGHR
ncbi:MAG: 2-phosphosulfolactate phosphatase [Candidatus Rokubacteria bacterium]|nr:2-phosphosulfolactate phosphatase [Candidatus Rokubacteria bacterium]